MHHRVVLPILPFLIERVVGTVGSTALSWHTGLLTGIYIFAIFMFAPLWGRISDRNGRRPVIVVGLTGFAATVALLPIAESLPLIYIVRFLSGAFAAAIERLYRDESLRRTLGEQGRARVAQFDAPHVAALFLDQIRRHIAHP